MKVLVATDAWHPQVNGVVRTLAMMSEATLLKDLLRQSPLAAQIASLRACIAECSMTSLPSGNHGFRFFNYVNACMTRHGCDPFAANR